MREERMSAEFAKYHVGDGLAFHHFTGPDTGGPHDHPGRIDVTVMTGGYVERVFHIAASGSWSSKMVERQPGDSFTIEPDHIHEIVALPYGDCWTKVRYHPHERDTRFWRFETGEVPVSRRWNEQWPCGWPVAA